MFQGEIGEMERERKWQPIRVLRIITAVGGIITISLAFALDWLGFGRPGSFGIGQVLLLVVGILGLLIALLGKKTIALYRDVAVILLNTIVLLIFLELAAIVFARSNQHYINDTESLPYYAKQDWTEEYFREAFEAEQFRYEPYVIWRHYPFNGSLMNLNQEGFRKTPDSECTGDAFTVFAFGGSTMLGWGSPDWGTITAYLQSNLAENSEESVCVVNYGQSGYVFTQSSIALLNLLQADTIPDIVIFYDGVNEVQAAYESGKAGTPVNLAPITDRFAQSEHPLVTFVKSTRMFALAKNWVMQRAQANNEQRIILNYQSQGVNKDILARAVADHYLDNYDLIEHLSKEYGFDYFFFLQPHLTRGNKTLTQEEQKMLSEMTPAYVELARTIYDDILISLPDHNNLWNLEHSFDDEKQQIWIDTGGHVTPEGNSLVAHEIILVLEAEMLGK